MSDDRIEALERRVEELERDLMRLRSRQSPTPRPDSTSLDYSLPNMGLSPSEFARVTGQQLGKAKPAKEWKPPKYGPFSEWSLLRLEPRPAGPHIERRTVYTRRGASKLTRRGWRLVSYTPGDFFSRNSVWEFDRLVD